MKNEFDGTIKFSTIQKIILLLYFISISAYQLGTGFDAIFVRLIFIVLMGILILFNKKIIFDSQAKWILLFWGFYFLSSIWAKNINEVFYYINNAIQIIGLSLTLPLTIKEKEDINSMLKLLIFSLVYTGILLLIRTPLTSLNNTRIGETIGLHPNTLGMRMAIGVIILLYLMDKMDRKINKIYYFICMILFLMLLLLTGSKKALALVILGFAAFELIKTKGYKKIIKITVLLILFFTLMQFVMNNSVLYSILGRRIERTLLTLQGTAIGLDEDKSLKERVFYIESALKLFKENPIVGYGGNNFVTYMREINYSHIAYSHNNFTELLCTLGIIGFCIYYYFWIKIVIILLKNFYKYKKKNDLLFLVIIAILLILDYGNVSYISVFNIILLTLANININLERKKNENN